MAIASKKFSRCPSKNCLNQTKAQKKDSLFSKFLIIWKATTIPQVAVAKILVTTFVAHPKTAKKNFTFWIKKDRKSKASSTLTIANQIKTVMSIILFLQAILKRNPRTKHSPKKQLLSGKNCWA